MSLNRFLLPFIFLSLSAFGLAAQEGLSINELFNGRYHSNPNATETIISGNNIHPNLRLTKYHSLTLTDLPEETGELERRVIHDGAKATSRESTYKGGHLYYGFYVLPASNGKSRYLFYLNRHLKGGNKAAIIYLEGNATPDEIKKMLQRKD